MKEKTSILKGAKLCSSGKCQCPSYHCGFSDRIGAFFQLLPFILLIAIFTGMAIDCALHDFPWNRARAVKAEESQCNQ